MGEGMKITINRASLLSVLKSLRNVAKLINPNDGDKWKDLLALYVKDGFLYLFSGQMAFILIGIPAEIQKEGLCHVSMSNLHDLVKVYRDEKLYLSVEKVMIIESDSGTRGRLALNSSSYPIEMVLKAVNSDTIQEVVLHTEELIDLCQAAKVFQPMGKFRYIEILCKDGAAYGSTHQTEQGGIENFSFSGEHDSELNVVVNPDWLSGILPFFGEYATLRTITAFPNQVIITDPDNLLLWGSTTQVTKNS